MTNTIPPAKRIDVLLNTLVGERYVRRPLLSELIDELLLANDRPAAVQAGRALLASLDSGIDEREYEKRIEHIVALTCPAPCFHAAE